MLVQTPEPLRSKTARAVVAGDIAGEGGADADTDGPAAASAAGPAMTGGDAEFPTISELTAERIRRAADIHSPGLAFTQLEVVEATGTVRGAQNLPVAPSD